MQTFVTIWWLKDPSKTIAVVSIVVQWLFAILFVTISYALHTHPGKEYFATPTPVIVFIWFLCARNAHAVFIDSSGVGLDKDLLPNESLDSISGSG